MKPVIIALLLVGRMYAQDTIKVKNEDQKEPATTVEVMPVPPGGVGAFYKYLAQNISYPDSARVKGISGKVFTRFVIETDGTLSNFQVLKGVPECPECDEEALRVLRSYPEKWTPGTQNGRVVRVYFNLPINFKVQ